MSEPHFLKLEKAEGAARITLARPKHNVLNIDMMGELSRLLEDLKADDALKCIIIAADGPSWCAGVEVADHKPELVDGMIAAFNRMLALVGTMAVPTIAAVHGSCLGGGMELAIACDIIIAAAKAKFGQPEIKLGFFPPYAAIRLPQLVGPAKAVEICATGKIYTADESKSLGFVSQVVPEDQFADAVNRMAAEIKACSPLIIRLNKKAVNQHLGMAFDPAVESVSRLFLHDLMKTADTAEGIKSFEEKRKALWQNR
jgi:cyclohexa-1,5-dienecarbonyl-CoA hydratase